MPIKSETDYRMLGEAASERTFLFPLTDETSASLDAVYTTLLGDDGEEPTGLRVPVMMGRELHVRGSRTGVCRATFDALCNTEKGTADYKALGECFISSLDLLLYGGVIRVSFYLERFTP